MAEILPIWRTLPHNQSIFCLYVFPKYILLKWYHVLDRNVHVFVEEAMCLLSIKIVFKKLSSNWPSNKFFISEFLLITWIIWYGIFTFICHVINLELCVTIRIVYLFIMIMFYNCRVPRKTLRINSLFVLIFPCGQMASFQDLGSKGNRNLENLNRWWIMKDGKLLPKNHLNDSDVLAKGLYNSQFN